MARKGLKERFWSKVIFGEGCWEWAGFLFTCGYGGIRDDDAKQSPRYAHRVSWQLHFGAIPDGLQICHKCDNPKCVRPDHLFLGTQADNNWDCATKGRQPGSRGKMRGENHPRAKLTWEIARAIRANTTDPNIVLARRYNIDPSIITRIKNGRMWKEPVNG